MQEVIIAILFIAALFFMGRHLWRQYKADSGCASAGCDACAHETTKKKAVKLPGHLKG